MSQAIEAASLRPIIDHVFEMGEAPEAFRHMQPGSHFGKIVIRVAS